MPDTITIPADVISEKALDDDLFDDDVGVPTVVQDLADLQMAMSEALMQPDADREAILTIGIESLMTIMTSFVGWVEEEISGNLAALADDLEVQVEDALTLHEEAYHDEDLR